MLICRTSGQNTLSGQTYECATQTERPQTFVLCLTALSANCSVYSALKMAVQRNKRWNSRRWK